MEGERKFLRPADTLGVGEQSGAGTRKGRGVADPDPAADSWIMVKHQRPCLGGRGLSGDGWVGEVLRSPRLLITPIAAVIVCGRLLLSVIPGQPETEHHYSIHGDQVKPITPSQGLEQWGLGVGGSV